MKNMSPFKCLLLDQLVMKIYLQVCRDRNFFIPTDELNGDIAFSQIVLHMDHIGQNVYAH